MNAKALVLLVFVAACVAGWFALSSGGDIAPLAPKEVVGGTSTGARPETAEVAKAGAADAGKAATAGLVRTAAEVAAVAEVGNTPSETRTVTILGRLVDPQGMPRADVTVELSSWRAFDGGEVDELVFAGRNQPNQPAPAKTKTQADGRFVLSLPIDRDGSVQPAQDDLLLRDEEPRVSGKKGDQDLGDLIVVHAGALQGVVHDQNGQPVAGVQVSATLGMLGFGSTSSATTPTDGSFSVGMLKPGKWLLRTASGQFLPSVEEYTLQAEERRTNLVITLKPGHSIAGQVIDDRRQPVVGFKVGSKRKEARGGVDIERFSASEATETDANGFFTLSGLAGESATLRAFGLGYTTATLHDVPIGTGNLLVAVERLAVIAGVLEGADGKPIAGSRIVGSGARANGPDALAIEEADGLPTGDTRSVATSGPDGQFRLESVKPGLVTVTANGKGHRPVKLVGQRVLPGQVVEGLRLVADPGAVVRVKVLDDAGKPVANAKVRAEGVPTGNSPVPSGGGSFARAVTFDNESGEVSLMGGPRLFGSAETDGDGLAILSGLPAGEAVLKATHAEFAPALATRISLPNVGTMDASLSLQRPGFAEVDVLSIDGTAAPEAAFRITGPAMGSAAGGNAEGQEKRGVTDAKGHARVGPLAPGEYTASLTKSSGGTRMGDAMVFIGGDEGGDIAASLRRFTVVAGEASTVELRRPVLTKVYGVVTGADGPAPSCVVELEPSGEGSFGMPGLGGRSTKTAADGSYSLDDVEGGSYTLRYGKAEAVVKATAPLEVPANLPDLRQDLALHTGKLRVQVCVQGTGDPIAGAEVEVVAAVKKDPAAPAQRRERRVMMVSMTNSESGGESTTMTLGSPRGRTDATGWAEIDDVPVGEYDLHVRDKNYAPGHQLGQRVLEQQTTQCGRVELAAAGQIRGKVVTADGKPAPMALVQSRVLGTEQWSEPQMASGGNFQLTGLPAGKHQVRGQRLSNGPPTEGPIVEVEVKGGETATTELRLPGN